MARSADEVMTRGERVFQAELALGKGDYDQVIAHTDALLERWPRDEQGLILRATALLFGPSVDPSEASRLLNRLPRERRKQADIQALDLWRDFRYRGSFMYIVRERMQMNRAKDLLAADPMDPLANLVAGMIRVEDQRYLDNSVRLISQGSEEEMTERLFYDSPVRIDPVTGELAFGPDRGGSEDIQILREEEQMAEVSEEAVRFLIRAAAGGPLHGVAVRSLTEAAIRGGRVRDAEFLLTEYVARYPDSRSGHLYLGLIRYMLTKDEMAAESFDLALSMMTEDEKTPWLHPRSVVSTSALTGYRDASVGEMDDFWIRSDREWSKPGNERLVEHMGRMAYADLIWGREANGLKGWEVEPGQVLVRYGFPKARMQFQTGEQGGSRFHILHYGSRYWIFEDLAKAGEPIFYSPPADFFQGGRAVMGNDWALIAAEQFRDNPLESDLDDEGKMRMEILPSVLEDEGSRTVIAPLCIRGAAFRRGSEITRFVRPIGAPVPPPSGTVTLVDPTACPAALSVFETDGRAQQVSLETRNGMYWSVGRFDIPERVGEGLRASDIVLASVVVEADPESAPPQGMFERNEYWIQPVAENRYNRGRLIHLYAEAYGLDAREGEILTIQAVLADGGIEESDPSRLGRFFGRRNDAVVSVSFEDEIHSNSQGRALVLETEDLAPGLYTLALRFAERNTGREAVTRREIRID